MKKIGIDARLYFQTGVGVYLHNFLYYLQKLNLQDIIFYVYALEKDASQIELDSKRFIIRQTDVKWHTLAEQTRFLQQISSDHLDLMHFTYFSYPVLYNRPFIATVHDITPLTHKTGRASTLPTWAYDIKYRAFQYVLASQVKNAKRIITPTHWVKNELVARYGKKYAAKIIPIYEGVSYELMHAKENTALSQDFKQPYFLYVGNFYPHKNVDRLIEAFSQIQSDTELVLAGPSNYFSEQLEHGLEMKKIKNVRFVHTGHMGGLVYLYKNALALVNPSLSEGFGLPLLEAAYFGTPVIASNLPVFYELLGDNYLAFDPQNVLDIREKLEMFLQSPQRVDYREIVRRYSFRRMTDEIVKIYEEILSS